MTLAVAGSAVKTFSDMEMAQTFARSDEVHQRRHSFSWCNLSNSFWFGRVVESERPKTLATAQTI